MIHQTKFVLYSTPALFGMLLMQVAVSSGKIAQPDRVAYTSFQPASNWDIYLFTQSGSVPRRLTDYPGLDYDPVVSPDGRWLVFCSERRGILIFTFSICNAAAILAFSLRATF